MKSKETVGEQWLAAQPVNCQRQNGWRIVEIDNKGRMKTLFHGIFQSRFLQKGRLYCAQEKVVSDGGTCYLSGFHVFEDLDECRKYMQRFTDKKKKRMIVPVTFSYTRPKTHSKSNVLLAKYMTITGNPVE